MVNIKINYNTCMSRLLTKYRYIQPGNIITLAFIRRQLVLQNYALIIQIFKLI